MDAMYGEKGVGRKDVRLVAEEEPRVESGAVQFGNDWPGLFLRGDESMMLANSIEALLTLVDGCCCHGKDDAMVVVATSYLRSLALTIREDVMVKRSRTKGDLGLGEVDVKEDGDGT